jgi:hypothetical protein
MRFEFYHAGIDKVPKLSVDGTVAHSVHFSHWQGNQTPPEVKADTSTEIALNLVVSPHRSRLTQNIELVTNNHFDTDGVLSVWTVLTGERALEFRELLISAAEAGDFSEFTNENAVRTSIAIQGSDQASPGDEAGSPLARYLAGETVDDDARSYELVLPEVAHLLTKINDYEPLWRDGWERVAKALESFERGVSQVREQIESKLSIVTLAPEVFSGSGFNPTRHAAPYTAISHYARGTLYLIGIPTDHGWYYRFDYPYYSWAETVVRPHVERRDFTRILEGLNEIEPNRSGRWELDNGEMTSAVKFLDQQRTLAASRLEPDEVADVLIAQTSVSATAHLAL